MKKNLILLIGMIAFVSCKKEQSSPMLTANESSQDESSLVALTIKPLAKWKLNEKSGTVAFDAIGGFNGRYKAGVIPGGGTPFLDGSPTARFDGKSGFVSLPPSSTISPTWKEITVEAWVHLDVVNGFEAILSPPSHGFVHFQSGVGNNVIYTSLNPPVGIDLPIYPGGTLLGKWHYVALVGKPGDSRVYLDGVRYGTNNTQPYDSIAQPPDSLRIGSGFDKDRFWNGSLAHVAIYNVALSDKDIIKHYYSEVGCNR
jgi:hypothetical protein